MKVKAAEGLLVPKEDAPREYIGAEPINVEPTAYYIRRLAAEELVEVTDETEGA